jgi:hypothetical protein
MWWPNPRGWDWHWIGWRVIVPLFGPTVVSAVAVFFWWTVEPAFSLDWHTLVNVSPWVLTFYCITLIGSTINDRWQKLADHQVLRGVLLAVVGTVAIYNAVIVIKRNDPHFTPGTSVYFVTLVLLVVSIGLCHHTSKI